ncbi:hypothetical protein GCM10023149_26050 [Mucilaginibacter gynuensis]|uniref:Outer membrane protein beta-barrel domain-containing protein n=1 Tax=Mucilaginibacter gynuensis TaxID=1302236 RepID=A0ABP8GHG9_9SPHI
MKQALKYLELWQQKRAGLPINDDANADWLDMQAMLDVQLPGGSTGGGSITQYMQAFKYKLLSYIVVAVSVTTVLYFALHKKQADDKDYKKHPLKNIVAKKNTDSTISHDAVIDADDNSNEAAKDSSTLVDSVSQKTGIFNDPDSVSKAHADTESKRNGPVPENTKDAENRTGINTDRAKRGGSAVDNNTTISPNKKPSPGASTKHGKNGARFVPQNAPDPNHNNSDNDKLIAGAGDRIQSYLSVLPPAQQTFVFYNNSPATPNFAASGYNINSISVKSGAAPQQPNAGKAKQDKSKQDSKKKDKRQKPSSPLNIDYGILIGVNAPGSFTPKSENSNFYGSSPVDAFAGAFVTYHFNNKLGINFEPSGLNPQKISGTYSAKVISLIDSGQFLTISDSRKLYNLNLPLHIVYKLNNYVSLKAGPIISIPLKSTAGKTTFVASGNRKDSLYYVRMTDTLKNITFQKRIDYGISGGVSFNVKRFTFDVNYVHFLRGQQVSSPLGTYTSKNGSVQFKLGFKLGKAKER